MQNWFESSMDSMALQIPAASVRSLRGINICSESSTVVAQALSSQGNPRHARTESGRFSAALPIAIDVLPIEAPCAAARRTCLAAASCEAPSEGLPGSARTRSNRSNDSRGPVGRGGSGRVRCSELGLEDIWGSWVTLFHEAAAQLLGTWEHKWFIATTLILFHWLVHPRKMAGSILQQ